MPDIPESAISAAAEAMNEAHAKRGWNKPQPWWVNEVVTAALEAAAPLLAEAWGVADRERMQEQTRRLREAMSAAQVEYYRLAYPDRGAAENGP
jgi:hypothetical protein